ncbi:Asp-tRNA(Asn)/Glu-tRNA(Gln) amidotransferase subunit GatB [Sulfuriroseicoccus oceanibius]|uniref:Aspartyl/glutamyl-tRNA(Asn/Gln) amidotransferase subunit B n=1 Tax=Sulfuriroseicoccus oceanibius TaxID=2707525 RepID=A0A6B3L325_9BACT|nr:Asp-tRNA(Asn)/Glu-tRNA(Gln) amidotransferase subunit GatB [Sulfuriroseicoccus oceanibius]QQL45491.1 Asp-tRNA(Asn)/Glu-tRNA(Gln) amidotransferase subunit GatB [Sulfuriroseicoccus oceanibius]
MNYLVTIGLEVHCQVKTQTKMFCSCPTSFGDEPNSNTCPVCMGLPGALPVLNKRAIEKTIVAGMMLGCTTPTISKWDRKNYFYPDMPKNYQISQLHAPLCDAGSVTLDVLHYPKDVQKQIKGEPRVIRLDHIHLEEDVAKSTHAEKRSLIDFNRAGTPLMEIVSMPDMETPEEAVAYLNALRQILVYGNISDADMEKGQMRCDVNVSLRPKGQQELGAKIELKNLNSISAVRRSLYYEIERQAEELDMGIEQVQSTRRWDDDLGETQLMRTKEDAHDYRYFPDPDLPPVETTALVESVKHEVPELPAAKRERFVEQFGMTDYDAAVLTAERPLADYFEAAAKGCKSGKKLANWVINELLGRINAEDLTIDQCPVTPEKFAALVAMIDEGKVSNNQGKEVFTVLWDAPGQEPAAIAKEKGFEQVSDTGAIEALVDEAINANPDKVAEIQGGNEKLVNWITGQVMKASKGKANPQVVTGMIREKLLG